MPGQGNILINKYLLYFPKKFIPEGIAMSELFCGKPFQMIDIKKNETSLSCWVDLQGWQEKIDDMTIEKSNPNQV